MFTYCKSCDNSEQFKQSNLHTQRGGTLHVDGKTDVLYGTLFKITFYSGDLSLLDKGRVPYLEEVLNPF